MEFFGLKTLAWFDVWSLEHFVTGIFVGSLILKSRPQYKDDRFGFYVALLAISYAWESVEFYIEAGYTGIEAVTYWFQGVEFWGNRLVIDPLMMVLGAWVYEQGKCRVLIPRVFSVVWLICHILIFPHSMFLHEMF